MLFGMKPTYTPSLVIRGEMHLPALFHINSQERPSCGKHPEEAPLPHPDQVGIKDISGGVLGRLKTCLQFRQEKERV